jgi:carbon starvation protein
MNTLIAIILAALAIYIGYRYYAMRIDRKVIQADPNRATPARMYMDGVDFVPASRGVLYGYHFKSIAAAGPIVGAITAANIWGWLPSMLWLLLGVMFIGWASDYSAIMVSVRNDGDSLSAIAHKLIAPRTRRILLVFIFFYLLLVAGAFGNLVAGVLNGQPQTPLAILALAVMGVLAGQMLYRWRTDLILATVITLGVTLFFVFIGPIGNAVQDGKPVLGPVAGAVQGFNAALNSAIPIDIRYYDPTQPLPQGQDWNVRIQTSFIFWLLFLSVFCYLGSILPIWRFAQPVNYLGFWITFLTIVLAGLGALLAVGLKPEVAVFKLPAVKAADLGFVPVAGQAWQPLWPMLFVTIACGAISGWHALIGSVSTARQLEYETDALPVGGGAMFSEMTLGMLSLMAVSVAGSGAGAPAFAAGIGSFLSVFGLPTVYGTALGFAAFVVIVITVVQLVIRVMRVTLTEGLGDYIPVVRNPHVGIIISLLAMAFLVLTGTWVYLWQLFGAANQLMASLSLLIVTVWLFSRGRNPLYAGIPSAFMYVTTMAASLVTARNLWETVLVRNLGQAGREGVVLGAGLMILIALLLVVAAAFIGYDAIRAIQRYRPQPQMPEAAPAPAV